MRSPSQYFTFSTKKKLVHVAALIVRAAPDVRRNKRLVVKVLGE